MNTTILCIVKHLILKESSFLQTFCYSNQNTLELYIICSTPLVLVIVEKLCKFVKAINVRVSSPC